MFTRRTGGQRTISATVSVTRAAPLSPRPAPSDPAAGRWERGWDRWQPALAAAAPVWLTTHLAFLVVAWVSRAIVADTAAPISSAPWASPFLTFFEFDSTHFLQIARFGPLAAGHADPNVAYFPGYPLLGRTFGEIIGLGHPSGFEVALGLALVAWLASFTAAVLLWRLAADEFGARVASASVLALLAGPYALFLVAAYSEGLFLTFALGAWLCARRARWGWAGLLCAVAMLVRINAGFELAGLAVLYLGDARRREMRVLRPEALALLAPIAVLAAYFGWLRWRTGEWLAWFRAQNLGWDRRTSLPWETLRRSVQRIYLNLPDAVRFQSVLEIVFAGALVAGVAVLLWRRRRAEATYVAVGTATLLTSTYYLSIPRTSLLAFPLLILLARWAVRTRHRWLVVALCVLSVALAALNTTTFVHGMWTD